MTGKSTDAHSVLPPKKRFLESEQLLELWDTRGMKYRFDELHQMMLNRGLATTIDQLKFRPMVFDILRAFLVDGDARIAPKHRPRQKFPRVH